MNICTCSHSTGAHAIRPWMEQISSAQLEQIRKNFALMKPMNEEPLAIHGKTAKTTEEAVKKPAPAVIDMGKVAEYHTGYARIDNVITDALRGKSQELKDSVYDIIRSDFLPNNVHGLEEADRLALISLGVEKAEYLAGQFMDEKTGASFMEAMRSIAGIGMEGTRVGTCEMKYNVKSTIAIDGNGYVHDDDMDEFLYSMERESPEDFAEYNRIRSSSGSDSELDVSLFALRWAMKNLALVAGNKGMYNRYCDDHFEKLRKIKLDGTFSGADTSDKDSFLTSIKEKLKASQNLQTDFFLEQIAQMAKAPGGYLTARRMIVSTRA